MKSGLMATALSVVTTLIFLVHVDALANVPGEQGYVPPENDNDNPGRKLLAMYCSDYSLSRTIANDPSIKCEPLSDDSVVIYSSLDLPGLSGKIESRLSQNTEKGITDDLNFFVDHKKGFKAALNGEPEPDETKPIGYRAGYFTGSAFQNAPGLKP
jgi:hypothetical protein